MLDKIPIGIARPFDMSVMRTPFVYLNCSLFPFDHHPKANPVGKYSLVDCVYHLRIFSSKWITDCEIQVAKLAEHLSGI